MQIRMDITPEVGKDWLDNHNHNRADNRIENLQLMTKNNIVQCT